MEPLPAAPSGTAARWFIICHSHQDLQLEVQWHSPCCPRTECPAFWCSAHSGAFDLSGSDSLNISERARWVAYLLGSARGHGCRDIIPSWGKKPSPRSIGQEATAALHQARSHHCAASGKKPQPRSIMQVKATAALHRARSHRRAVSDSTLATTAFTFILRISPPPMVFTFIPSTPPIILSFNFLLQLLDWPVGNDSLNISPRAHWVVCPLGSTRGHSRVAGYIPLLVREYKKEDSM